MHITDSNGNTKHVYGGQTYSTAEAANNARNADAAIRAEQSRQRAAETWNPLIDQTQQAQQSRFSEEANKPEQRRSNNEYRRQQEQQTSRYSQEANDDSNPFAAWEADQREKDAHYDNYLKAAAEAQRLQQEGQARSQIWENGVYMGEDKEAADTYAALIKEQQDIAARELEASGRSGKKFSDMDLFEQTGTLAKGIDTGAGNQFLSALSGVGAAIGGRDTILDDAITAGRAIFDRNDGVSAGQALKNLDDMTAARIDEALSGAGEIIRDRAAGIFNLFGANIDTENDWMSRKHQEKANDLDAERKRFHDVLGDAKNPIANYNDLRKAVVQEQSAQKQELYADSPIAATIDKYGTMAGASLPSMAVATAMALAGHPEGAAAMLQGGMAEGTTAGLAYISAINNSSKMTQLGQMMAHSLGSLLRNPTFYVSMGTEMGNAYNTAIEEGADQATASLYASVYGGIAAIVELGGGSDALGGLEKTTPGLMDALRSGDLWGAAKLFAGNILSEVGEEELQGMLETGLKSTYSDVPIYSDDKRTLTSDFQLVDTPDGQAAENAIINPRQMAETAKDTAITTALLGGAQQVAAGTATAMSGNPRTGTEAAAQPESQPQQTAPEAETSPASEPVASAETPVPAAQPQTQAQADVIDILMHPTGENGKISNSRADEIRNNPEAWQAFLAETNLTEADFNGKSKSETRSMIKDAGATWLADNAKANKYPNTPEPLITYEEMDGAHKAAYNKAHTHTSVNEEWDNKVLSDIAKPGAEYLKNTESLADINGNRFAGRNTRAELVEKVVSFFSKNYGDRVHSNTLGEDVIVKKEGFKSDVKHGYGPKKVATFEAIPAVLRDGQILSVHDGTIKKAGYIIGGKIKLDGKDSYVYCVLTISGDNNKFYLHEVADENGVIYYESPEENNNPASTGVKNGKDEASISVPADAGSPSEPTAAAAENEVQNSVNSNIADDQNSVNTDSVEDAGAIGGPADQGQNQGNSNASGNANTQEGNDTTGGNPNQNSSSEESNPGQNGGNPPGGNPPIDDRSAPGTGKEKTSQTFSNTLTREEGDSLRDPLTYLSKSDVETTQRAMERLGMNGEAEMATLMSKETWNDEQVQMSNIIRTSLFADAQKTGDWTAYDSFRKVYDEHMRVIARALRQAGNYDGQTAEGVARMAGKYLDMMENKASDDLKRNPNDRKAKDDLAEIKKARQATNETAGEIGALEAEEAELIKNGATEEEAWNKVKDRYLDLGQKLVAQRNMGLIFDNILLRNARIRNGAKNVNTLLRKMLSTRSPEYIRNYVRANNAGLATDATYKMHPTAKQAAAMVSSFHKMCMLFGTGTTLRNTESNAVFGALDWASNNTGGAIADSVIGLMTGNRARGMEAGILSGNTWKAAFNAGLESVLEISANMDMREDGKYVNGTQAFSPYNPGARLIARLNQVLGYALNTTDAVAYAGAQESAANAAKRANERRGGNMTDETAEAIGKQEAAFRTLKDQNVATELLGEVQQAFDLLGFGGEIQYKTVGGKKIAVGRKGGYGLGSFNVPFVGVPVNLKLKPLQYSAPGAALGAIHAAQAVKLAKGAAPNSAEMQESLRLQHQASGEIGRGVTGTALLIVLRSLLKKAKDDGKEWFKDWDLEEDKDVKAQNRAEGKFGQQINLSMLDRIRNGEDAGRWQRGDETVDISSNEPTNSFLQMASIMADDEDASTPEALFKALWQTEKSNLSDLPCLDAINNFRDTYNNNPVYNEATETDEEGNAEEPTVNEWKTFLNATGAMAGSAASGFTFAPLRHAAAVRDDYQRDTTGNNPIETAWNRTLLGIPGKHGRESLPIKTDSYGNELTNGDRNTRIKNTYLAMKYGTIQQSEVSEEVERIREETGISLTPSRYAPKTVTFGSGKDQEKVRLTAEEGKEYTKAKGQEFERRYQELMENPLYQNADSDTQAAMGSKMEAFAKDSAKADVAENHGIEYESKFDYAREMDDPVAFLAAQAGIAQAEKDGNLDAVDMILQSVRSQNMSRQEEETYGKHIQGFNRLNYLTENGMRTERAQEFDNDLKSLYEGEKRTAARGSDYFRTACSGKYSDTEADAIMSYETAVTLETENNYKDRVQYNLNQANLGSMQGTVWGWIEECADGNMTTDQFNKNLNKAGIPAKQQYEIKQVRESMTEDKHAVGKTVSGVYRAMREVGYTPEQAYQFYEYIDADYNGSYKKSEFDKACAKAFGSNWKNTEYGRQVRALIKQYVGK